MANAIYPQYKDALLTGASNSALTGSGTTGLYCVLVDTASYAYSDLHEFYTSLAGIVGAEQEVTSVLVNDGIVDGNNVTYPSVPAGPALEALVLYRKNTGPSSTWRLVCYLDSGVSGLPVTPNGGDITVSWNAAGIFKL